MDMEVFRRVNQQQASQVNRSDAQNHDGPTPCPDIGVRELIQPAAELRAKVLQQQTDRRNRDGNSAGKQANRQPRGSHVSRRQPRKVSSQRRWAGKQPNSQAKESCDAKVD